MQQRKIPVRRCVGCNAQKPKRELVRVVRSPDGAVSVDLTGKKAGRGAYVCPSPDCLKKARKARMIERSFQCRIPEEVYDAMEDALQKYAAGIPQAERKEDAKN